MRRTRTWGLAGAAIGILAIGGFLVQHSTGPAGPTAPAQRSVPELIEALAESAPEERREAAEALTQLGPGAVAALQPLLEALKDSDVLARAQAVVALGRLGPVAVGPLTAALASPDVWTRRGATAALGLHGAAATAAIDRLVEVLGDADEAVRMNAAKSLSQIGPAAVEPLLAVLRDTSNTEARALAVEALGQIGPAADDVVGPLVAALHDPEPRVSWAASQALTHFGALAVEPLAAVLQSPAELPARRGAAHALCQVGPQAPSAVGALTSLLGDTDSELRRSAAVALGRMGRKALPAVPRLQEVLRDEDVAVRRSAAEALGQIGRGARAAVPTLLELQSDQAVAVRHAATHALMRIVLDNNSQG